MPYLEDQQEQLRSFLHDKIIVIPLALSLIVNVILWGFLVWRMNSFSELIPLHYTIYFGIDLFGPWYRIFILPLLGLLVLVVNFSLAIILFTKEIINSYFLVISSAFLQILLLIASIAVVYIIQ